MNPPLRVLFVDDELHRLQAFQRLAAGAGAEIDVRWRACAAVVLDDDLQWAAAVCLDFMMCAALPGERCPNPPEHWPPHSRVPPPCDCPTGAAVAARIARLERPPHVVVHSMSLEGLRLIGDQLLRADVYPKRAPFESWRMDAPAVTWRQMGLM